MRLSPYGVHRDRFDRWIIRVKEEREWLVVIWGEC